MTAVFLILFIISCVFFPCQGQITSPPDGSTMTVLPRSTVNITWSFSNDVSQVIFRSWFFTSSDGSFVDEPLARIIDDENPRIDPSGLSGVSIVKPATLILKNVNQTYDGTYRFDLTRRGGSGSSHVVVIIARKPTVTVNCSSPITVDENHDLICLCKGENGNPPADVIWYNKSSNPIGQKKKEQKILVLRNVTEADRGIYTCQAQSHTLMDEKSIEVKVSLNYKPNKTDIKLSSTSVMFGQEVTITCTSNGQPDPSFTIVHNGTIHIAVVENTYTKQVNWSDAGNYSCVAMNKLGINQSDTKFLNVTVKGPTTSTTPTTPTTSSEGSGTVRSPIKDDGLSDGAIAGIVIGVLVLVVIIIGGVYYYKSKQRNGYKGNANVKPGDNGSEDAAENTYDTASGPSGSRTKPSKGDAPVVYSAVDKENRQGRPLYATLDEAAMRVPNNRKTPEEERPEPTQYASIEFGKTDEVPKADLV